MGKVCPGRQKSHFITMFSYLEPFATIYNINIHKYQQVPLFACAHFYQTKRHWQALYYCVLMSASLIEDIVN